jgi:uncharacterized protein with PQ loop repeat
MDIPLVAGTVSTVAFAVSNLPMLRKALRTRDVSSYSLSSMAMINAANAVYSLYVFSLPLGPIWALHTFYLVSCAIMLVLCLVQRRAAGRREASRSVSVISVTESLEPVTRVPESDRSPDARAWSGAPRPDPAAR